MDPLSTAIKLKDAIIPMVVLISTVLLIEFNSDVTIGLNYQGMFPRETNLTGVIPAEQIPGVKITSSMYFNDNLLDNQLLKAKFPEFSWVILYKTAMIREIVYNYELQNVFLSRYYLVFNAQAISFRETIKYATGRLMLNYATIYESVVYLYSTFTSYGHLLSDGSIAAIIHYPKELIQKSHVCVRYNKEATLKFLKELCPNNLGTIYLPQTGLIFAEKVYVVRGHDNVNGMMISCLRIREMLYKIYKLENIEPKACYFVNRKWNAARYISNMEKFMNAAQDKYPNMEFVYKGNSFFTSHIKNICMAMASAKYLVTPAGSSVFNVIFMQNNTGCFIIGSNRDDWADYGFANALHIWISASYNENIDHYKPVKNKAINIEYNMKFFDRLVYAVENKKWPDECYEDTNIQFFFNYKLTRKILELDINQTYGPHEDEDALYKNLTKK